MTKGKRAGDGPLAVEVEKGKSYYWCACGQSKKQPFCDGSHMSPLNDEGTKFTPFAYKAKETKKMFSVRANKPTMLHSVMVLTINKL